jgi:protein arginine N-methyltransferase 2
MGIFLRFRCSVLLFFESLICSSIDSMEVFLQAAAAGDVAVLSEVLARLEQEDIDPSFVTDENGATALHAACAAGQAGVAQLLMQSGMSYKLIDKAGRTPAEYALQAGHQKLYADLVEEGVRAEMVLSLLSDMNDAADDDDDSDIIDAVDEAAAADSELGDAQSGDSRSKAYLSGSVKYDAGGELLTDAAGDAVMMQVCRFWVSVSFLTVVAQWEKPLMERHAAVLAPRPGLDVLNIGFGLGLIDTALQQRSPHSHTIVEAHPGVLARMEASGWMQRPGVRVIAGRWQDTEPQLGTYDAVFFDTFGEDYQALRRFHALLPRLLRPGGVYSFFNGLAGGQPFLHDVFCPFPFFFPIRLCAVLIGSDAGRVAELHLASIGLDTRYEPVRNAGAAASAADWTGIRRQYWSLPEYRLPICTWSVQQPGAAAAAADDMSA